MDHMGMRLNKAIGATCAARGKISYQQLHQLTREWNDDDKLPTVHLSRLTTSEVARTLCLKPAENDHGLGSSATVPLPELLIEGISTVDSILDERSMDAAIRFRVNYFLLYALTEAMDSQTGERQPLELHDEDKWSFGPVQYKDMAVTLSGHPSYAMWNGDEDEAASNVILVRGRMRGEPEECIAEVLGYMGFIYHHRRNANKANHPLYGVATDSRTFHFVRLDNDSTYVTATVDSRVDLEKAFSLLVRVFKEAMTVPPVLQEPSTQSARGWRPAKSLVPIQSSLRRKVDRKAQYRRLKADGSDGLFEDIDDEELRDYIEHETSEDEYHEDQGNPDAWTWLKRCCHSLFV